MSTTIERTVETEAQALHRLARQAHKKGVELVIDEDNRHWATSASHPGERHVVTFYSCDCVGFARHGRCMHLALCLEAYHSLPPLEPTPGGDDVPMPRPIDLEALLWGDVETSPSTARDNAEAARLGRAYADAIAASLPVEPAGPWVVEHQPVGELAPWVVRYIGAKPVERPVRRYWRERAAWRECREANADARRAADSGLQLAPVIAAVFGGEAVARAA